MDKKHEILLNSTKNIESVDVDTFTKLNLENKISKFNEYNVRNVLSVTELFELEREENEIYRIYGGLEYVSLFDGVKQDYEELSDFFIPQMVGNIKNIFNSFDFYLVRPSDDEYVNISKLEEISDDDLIYGIKKPPLNFPTTTHKRTFKTLTKINNFELFNAAFSKNVFNDKKYIYQFNIDFDISEYLDGFGMPLTELFLFAQYKPSENELLTFETWDSDGNISEIEYLSQEFNIGDSIQSSTSDTLVGDLVEFSRPRFYQRQDTQQTFRISTPLKNNKKIKWRYNPFIPIKLRYFEEYLNVVNENSDSYEDLEEITDYAFRLNNGDMIWRNIMSEGYVDPLTGIGTNHPFVNKKRYLFNNIILGMYPDLNDNLTKEIFEEIWYDRHIININTQPITNINDINKPC